MPYTAGFNHVATLTPDLDRYVEFYGAAFGAEVVFEMDKRDDHPRMIILDLGGGAALNIFEVEPSTIIGDIGTQGGRGAIDHFGLSVRSIAELEATRGRLAALGADIGEIHQLGDTWSLFFRDCDGRELEVCCESE